ncbi:signal peptidase I [Roseibium sp. Sym1]|uniref:signal peptidase I n=1 Tax=Roseibium sp. Sym1 TaxID=3016006 RepID=UPI0022B3A8D1|nr:signal peptidase I [Roseibium sp. Sym1]
MARRLRSLVIPGLVLLAVILVGVAVSWNHFYLLRLKAYNTPAGSMEPALQVGDMFLAERIVPDFGATYEPVRGDIIVFDLPTNPEIPYVKRLIGLPGDRIQMRDGKVYLNGEPLRYEKSDDYVRRGPDGAIRSVPCFKEILPGGRAYQLLDLTPEGVSDNTREFEIPEGHVFVLGDNRDNSVDSRYISRVGYVPIENITGIARRVYFSGPEESLRWRSLRPDMTEASASR